MQGVLRAAQQQIWEQRCCDRGSGYVWGLPHEPVHFPSAGLVVPQGYSEETSGTPSTSHEASFEKAGVFARIAPVGLLRAAVTRGPVGGAEGDISGTQLQPLWALGTRTGTEGTPGTSGSLASHLCLHGLNSSACFVDTWPRLSGHLLPFLLCWQPFPCLLSVAAGAAPPVCNRPWPGFPSAGQVPLGDPRWLGGKSWRAAVQSAFLPAAWPPEPCPAPQVPQL